MIFTCLRYLADFLYAAGDAIIKLGALVDPALRGKSSAPTSAD